MYSKMWNGINNLRNLYNNGNFITYNYMANGKKKIK